LYIGKFPPPSFRGGDSRWLLGKYEKGHKKKGKNTMKAKRGKIKENGSLNGTVLN
jgi:hypothetical protein